MNDTPLKASSRNALRLTGLMLAGWLAAFACNPGFAQETPPPGRVIPAEAKQATMEVVDANVYLNGKLAALAPGLVIRDKDNLIVLRNALSGKYLVRVQPDITGMVHRIWIIK